MEVSTLIEQSKVTNALIHWQQLVNRLETLLKTVTKRYIDQQANHQAYQNTKTESFTSEDILLFEQLTQIIIVAGQHLNLTMEQHRQVITLVLEGLKKLGDYQNLYTTQHNQLWILVNNYVSYVKTQQLTSLTAFMAQLETLNADFLEKRQSSASWPTAKSLWTSLQNTWLRETITIMQKRQAALIEAKKTPDQTEQIKEYQRLLRESEGRNTFLLCEKYLRQQILATRDQLFNDNDYLQRMLKCVQHLVDQVIIANQYTWLWEWLSEIYIKTKGIHESWTSYCLSILASCCPGQPITLQAETLQTDSEYYRQKLAKYREQLSDKLELELEKALDKFNGKMAKFFKRLLGELESWLGWPEMDYCVLAFGSLSRQSMLAYSDVELAVLKPNDKLQPLLEALLTLFEFKLVSLGEMNGLFLDEHMQHLYQQAQTPEALANSLLTWRCSDGNSKLSRSQEMICSLLHASYLAGNEDLFKAYQTAIQAVLLQRPAMDGLSQFNYHDFALQQLKFHYQEFTKLPKEKVYPLDLKKNYTKPLSFMALDLALYFNYSASTLMAAAEALQQNAIVPTHIAQNIKTSFFAVQTLRCRQHLNATAQTDEISELTAEEFKWLNQLDEQLLFPYYSCLPILLDNNFELFKTCWQVALRLLKQLPHSEMQMLLPCVVAYRELTKLDNPEALFKTVFLQRLDELLALEASETVAAKQNYIMVWIYWGLSLSSTQIWQFDLPLAKLFANATTQLTSCQDPIKTFLREITQLLQQEQPHESAIIEALKSIIMNSLRKLAQEKVLQQSTSVEILFKTFLAQRHRFYQQQKKALELNEHPLFTLLSDYPSPEGWSPTYEIQWNQWLTIVQSLFHTPQQSPAHSDGSRCIISGFPAMFNTNKTATPNNHHHLPVEITRQRFDALTGEVISNPEYSSHTQDRQRKTKPSKIFTYVWESHTLFFRFKEGNRECLLGREMAVELLHRQLGGKLALAPGWPLKLTYMPVAEYPKVHWGWLSLGINGESLGRAMLTDAELIKDKQTSAPTNADRKKLNQIDPLSYSQLFVLALLTFPEDGQPWNFLLEELGELYRLVAIDTGQSFVNPWGTDKKGNLQKTLNIKTMLYLLPNFEQPLALEVRAWISLLNVNAVINQWRQTIDQINSLFQPIIGHDLKAAKIPEMEWEKQNKLINISEEQVEFIHFRLFLIQSWLNRHPMEAAKALLAFLDPLVAAEYNKYQRQIKTPKDFYAISPHTYVLKPILRKDIQQHCQASSQNYQAILNNALQLSYIQLDKAAQENYIQHIKSLRFEGMITSQQHFFLMLMKELSFSDELSLAYCTELTDSILETILKKSTTLTSLDISYCPNITEKSWLNIGWYCKNIENINLQGNKQFKKLGKNTLGFNDFKKLKKLNIADCKLEQKNIFISLKNISLNVLLLKDSQKSIQAINYDYPIKIVLLGYDGVGKTSCLIRFYHDIFRSSILPTVGVDIKLQKFQFKGETVNLQIWDTAGQDRFKILYKHYLRDAKAVIIFMDITRKITFDMTRQYMQDVDNISILLVANKCDLENHRKFTYEEGIQFAQKIGALSYIECSAKENININEAFTLAVRVAMGEDIKNISIKNMSLAVPVNKPLEKNQVIQKPVIENYDHKIENLAKEIIKIQEAFELPTKAALDKLDVAESLKNQLLKNSIKISKLYASDSKEPYDYQITILLLGGNGAAGKSSCIKRFAEGTYMDNGIISTIGVDSKEVILEFNGKKAKVKIWDTASQKRFNIISYTYIRIAQAIIFIMDITDNKSLDLTREDIIVARKYTTNKNKNLPILLMANKSDMEHEREYAYEKGIALAHELGAFDYIECSAKTGTNVKQAFMYAVLAAIDKFYKKIDPLERYNNLEQSELIIFQKKINQLDYLNTPEVLNQRLESQNAVQRYLAADKLIKIGEFASYETKILYALGRNLAGDSVSNGSKYLLQKINKLTAREVSKRFIDELKINEGISLYSAEKIIEHGYFLTYSWQIIGWLLTYHYSSQGEGSTKDVINLLQKIIDEKLHGEDIKIKEYIEINLITYDTRKQAAYKILSLSRILHQMQRTAPHNSSLSYLCNEIIQKILEQIPEIKQLTKNEQITIINYAKDKTMLTKQHTREVFWGNFFAQVKSVNELILTDSFLENIINISNKPL